MGRRGRGAGGVHGILLVDKPVGPTSHDLVGWVRRLVGSRRVGHCGTLDPAASGLLVIAVGVATRAVSLMSSADKTYRADVILGRKTDSGDREGAVLEEVEVSPEIAEAAIQAAYELVGEHKIAPPAYSAIKVDGERAYARVRRGEVVEMELRAMNVLSVENVEVHVDVPGKVRVSLDMCVSKGTYVRSLAELLGERLGLPAYLGGLRRLACGGLRVDDPRALHPQAEDQGEEARWRWTIRLQPGADGPERAPPGALLPLDETLDLPTYELDGSSSLFTRLTQGQALRCQQIEIRDRQPGELVSLVARDPAGALVTLILARVTEPERADAEGSSNTDQVLRPERVLHIDKVVPSA